MRRVFRGVWPFVLIDLMVLGLIIAAPALALWIPGRL